MRWWAGLMRGMPAAQFLAFCLLIGYVQQATSQQGISIKADNVRARDGARYNGPKVPNPQVNSKYEVLEQRSNVVGIHLVQLPGVPTDRFLFWERPSGFNPNRSLKQIAGTFDLTTRAWEPVESANSIFCSGQTVDAEGRVIIPGGHRQLTFFNLGMRSVHVYDPRDDAKRVKVVAKMGWNRWYATGTLLPDGKVLIKGGTQGVGAGTKNVPNYELFDYSSPSRLPSFAIEPTYLKEVKQNYYPFNYILPGTGDVLVFCGRSTRIHNPHTGAYAKFRNGSVWTGQPRPGSAHSQYPYTSTSVMTALTPDNDYSSVDIIVFGGAPLASATDPSVIAGRHSHRATITWTKTGGEWEYEMSPWVEEDSGIPRVMGDATLLPNGDVILTNGAQSGSAGDLLKGRNRADYPALWAQLYQPDGQRGERYTTLAASTIPRLYHSTAALTMEGKVLVAGCDRCSKLKTDTNFWEPSEKPAEYRLELLHTPYNFDRHAPAIVSIDGDTSEDSVIKVSPGDILTITWRSATSGQPLVPVTRVSLVASSAVTHSFNTNQRVVFLPIISSTSKHGNVFGDAGQGTIKVKIPESRNVVIPQYYMLFILNNKTYSKARWIKVQS